MKKFILFILYLCCAYSNVSLASSESDALKALLNPVNSMQAQFQQTVTNENGKVLQHTRGSLWLHKPKQFRWEIKGEDARLIVSNGKKIWDYDEDLSQVSIQPLAKNAQKLPIFFLSGDVTSLDQDFNVKYCQSSEKNTCFELIPKESADSDEQSGIFQRIVLRFENQVLKALETVDQLGQKTVFKFKDVKLNVAIPESRFQFVPPKGVDIIGKE